MAGCRCYCPHKANKEQTWSTQPKHTSPDEIQYELSAGIKDKEPEIEQRRKEAGCFVMLTNLPKKGELAHTGGEVLKAYKDQNGVERNFAFLKDPLIVNDLFLKKPKRIEVLGMILLIALLIWNLMERSMRQFVEVSKKPLPGWDGKETEKPTSFMMSAKFFGTMVTKIDNHRMRTKALSSTQSSYLLALGLTSRVFVYPKPG